MKKYTAKDIFNALAPCRHNRGVYSYDKDGNLICDNCCFIGKRTKDGKRHTKEYEKLASLTCECQRNKFYAKLSKKRSLITCPRIKYYLGMI